MNMETATHKITYRKKGSETVEVLSFDYLRYNGRYVSWKTKDGQWTALWLAELEYLEVILLTCGDSEDG